MLSAGLKFFTDIPMTVVAMLLFVGAFTGAALWVLFRGGPAYEKVAQQPLHEEKNHNG